MIYKRGDQTISGWVAKPNHGANEELSDPAVSDFSENLIGSEFGPLKTISAALVLWDSLRKHPPLFFPKCPLSAGIFYGAL
ncbi:hypothetical protein I5R65_18630 [Herbaspirillum sp. AP02]|uniref:hypothetical protein n=1 Tax=unclassified Herbaspirillum TaxID=2624150 RepID=UPI0015DB9D7C|nr:MULTISPECIES: hypothetical protein [unclassified Herbaspirillum]MBG7621488.1 hypothetical protein [Herbaspirillum sp. AP02]NZD67037.1 hypothetical protein [Herbaspirillum sp. AP21]